MRALIFIAFACAACADDFTAYNEVIGHRVLGIRATPPSLRPGESSTLDALVTSDATSYRWSWCPVPFGTAAECPVDEATLRAAIAASGSNVDPPPYDLGTAATARFEHVIDPAALAGFCAAIAERELPEGVTPPRCNGEFDISVRATVAADTEIVAERKLGLIYDDAIAPNSNPKISGGRLAVRGAPPFELVTDAATSVVRDVEYALEVDVVETDAESYNAVDDMGTPIVKREQLTITWFFEGGEMHKERTSLVDGITDLTTLRTNSWRTPTVEELDHDTTRLYFVIRDSRGGLDWLTADLELRP